MEYIKLGKSSLNISRITLGTWAIGGSNWDNYSEMDAINAIESAIENGINFIDTAPSYGAGKAEELVGRVIEGRRDRVIIATKCGLNIARGYANDLSPKFIEKDLSHSLQRLNTDYIDLYQCHWPDPNTPIQDTMEALVEFQKQGKIRYIGISNFSNDEILESVKYAEITSLQPHYSLLERKIESGIQDTCLKNKIAIIPYGSLGGGVLTGKYDTRPIFNRLDARTFFYQFYNEKYWPKVKALTQGLKNMALEKGVKPGHLAIAWLLSRKGVASALVGTRNPAQVYENIQAIDLKLSNDEIDLLNTLSNNVYEINPIN